MIRPLPLARFFSVPVTAVFLGAAVALYGAELAGQAMEPFHLDLRWFDGEPWRLLTSTFVHGGALHLVFNVYWIWVLGARLEERWGSLRLLLLFVLTGVGAAAAEYGFFRGGIGLSGVGYGLVGFLWAAARRRPEFLDLIDRGTVQLFVVWFFVCILLTIFDILPIGNVAHGVGAALGVGLGFAATTDGARRAFWSLSVLVLVGAGIASAAPPLRVYVNLSQQGGADAERLALDALEDGDLPDAVRLLEHALRFEPDNARYWHNYGVALFRAGRHEDAERALAREEELEREP